MKTSSNALTSWQKVGLTLFGMWVIYQVLAPAFATPAAKTIVAILMAALTVFAAILILLVLIFLAAAIFAPDRLGEFVKVRLKIAQEVWKNLHQGDAPPTP
jgi:hypothetical protein